MLTFQIQQQQQQELKNKHASLINIMAVTASFTLHEPSFWNKTKKSHEGVWIVKCWLTF